MFKKKQTWMKVHLYLSLFFLPAALIYAITGSFYLFGIREEANATIHEIKIDSLPKGDEQSVILRILKENNLKIPKDTTLRTIRGNPSMGSIRYSVMVMKTRDGYVLRAVERSLYGILLLMHKGKGGVYFDIIAVGFSASLILFYVSGLIITSFCNKKRKPALLAFLLGFIITGVMIFLSI